jgi:hypothetical protein
VARFSVIVGRHTMRAGADDEHFDYQHFPVSENFSFGTAGARCSGAT